MGAGRADPRPARRGSRTKSIGSWSDVTERKGAELRLHESEEQYRILFDSNPHPMWVYDQETFAFLAVNDAAVRHYGYSRDEFLAMTAHGHPAAGGWCRLSTEDDDPLAPTAA